MKKDKIIYIQILVLILFVICSNMLHPAPSDDGWERLTNCKTYNNNWTIETLTQSQDVETLPVFFHTQNNEQDIWISKTLENVKDSDCIGFFTFQQQVSIFLDGKLIYEFVPDDTSNSLTPGNKWNLLPLYEHTNGKTLTIHIYQCYSKNRVTIPTIYYGTQVGIVMSYLFSELRSVAISLGVVLFGALIGLFCLLNTKKTDIIRSLSWLALLAIFRGFWGFLEANLYSFFTSNLLLISQISYLCLKLAIIIYIKFVNCTFYHNESKHFRFLQVCSILDFWGTAFLQFFGIVDFANTVFITHGILLIGSIYTCITVYTRMKAQQKDSSALLSAKRHNTYFAQLLCTLFLILTAVIDLVRYYTTNSPDIAQYSRVGDIIYVVTMLLALFLDFIYLINMGHKAAIIQEEASLDPMTKLRNRATFEKDIDKATKNNRKHQGIIVLDLNNLKLFNDCHGHDAGDQYIVTASEYIRDTFSPCGNAYRIGGDEFCIITEKLTEEKFLELQSSLEEQMHSISTLDDSLHMEVSSGFANFDSHKDSSLRDTMKRADEQMYKRKQELKGEAGR